MIARIHNNIFIFLIIINSLSADSCLSSVNKTTELGCSITNILQENSTNFRIHEEAISNNLKEILELNISKNFKSVHVKHNQKEILIKREAKNKEHTCPPFCIQPLQIKNVQTLGELEVLKFIKTLKEKKAKLLIDSRSSTLYKINTIPGAVNIPYNMLKTNSKYQDKVLELLGGKKDKKLWSFKIVPTLLIFGNSEEEDQASQAIHSLIELSYPSNKILYYRGGIKAWKRLGLTLY